MISVTELRAGATYKEDGQLLQVVSYEHIKMGRGSANIKVKVKNLKTGSTVEKSYINGAKVDNVHVLKKDLQFLYKDDEKAYFMNNATYEQVEVLLVTVPDHQFLKEGETFNVSFLGDEALTVTLPPKMVFKVVDTAPGIKGNSATNVFKDATLENNIQTKVPLFINIGESIKIDTRTGSYSEKAT
ncbi:MAG: elongation factor [Patescibacteria group bacterium]|jgi:elongation factor P|nr:elongation factor [Patescibacteria group bacterium]